MDKISIQAFSDFELVNVGYAKFNCCSNKINIYDKKENPLYVLEDGHCG